MSCNVIQRGDLDAYVTGELSSPEARSVEAHLFGCSECATELRRLRAEQRLFRARAEQHTAAVPSFEGVLARIDRTAAGKSAHAARSAWGSSPDRAPARSGTAGKGSAARPSTWSSRLAPAGVAVAALAAAAASWVGVRQTPTEAGPPAREAAEEAAIGPDRVCTSEAPVSDEPAATMTSVSPERATEAVARGQEDLRVCGPGDGSGAVCGGGIAQAAETCDSSVAWCSARSGQNEF